MNENTVAMFAIICIFGLPVLAYIVTRILRHAERMELLRRGIIPPPDFNSKRAAKEFRQAGAAWVPPPGATAVPPAGWTAPEDDPQRAMFKGIRLAFIGLAITIGLSFIGGPALLGGLIPMFVGVAQIIIALLSGAQLPGVAPRTTFIPPPPPRPSAGPPPPGFGSNGAPWQQPQQQPGHPHFEELSKPVPPPDTR